MGAIVSRESQRPTAAAVIKMISMGMLVGQSVLFASLLRCDRPDSSADALRSRIEGGRASLPGD